MRFTFYTSTILPSLHVLDTLTHILTKASQHPNAATLPSARLAPDMRSLSSQIHLAAQTIERLLCRLNKTAHVPVEDTITSFEEMHARIASTRALLESVSEASVNASADEVAPTDLTRGMVAEMSGAGYAEGALANLHFHLGIAYAICRAQGVPLGKPDYIMPFVKDHLGGVDLSGAVKERVDADAAAAKKEEERSS